MTITGSFFYKVIFSTIIPWLTRPDKSRVPGNWTRTGPVLFQ